MCALDTEAKRNKLEVIYTTYLDTMSKAAHKYVGMYQMDEDIVHEAIMKLIDNLDKIDLDNELSTGCYVRIVTECCAKDWLRREKHYQTDNLDDYDYMVDTGEPLPLDLVVSDEAYAYLVNCIRSLKDTYRSACELKYVVELKEREIADVLGISEKNVSVRIYRGRMILKKMLEEMKK